MKKKLTAVALIVCMLAIMLVGASLAYFTDDEQATNTMTIGNVQINIDEFQKNAEGKWEPFADKAFTLYPVDWSVGTTYRNKVVYTANVSSSKDDAYIRTIVLFEANDKLTADFKGQSDCCVPGLHFNYFADATATSIANGKTIHGAKVTDLNLKVNVKGNDYWVVLFEEVSGKAVPHDEALFSLNGVFMDKNITSEQIAGWGTDGVDIIVFSQGIQSAGLTYEQAMTELGAIDQANLTKWIGEDDADINDWAN